MIVSEIDNEIIAREDLFIMLYKQIFPSVAAFVNKYGGNFDDAKDIFQDALVIYYEKVIVNAESTNHNGAYLFGIARHLWYKKSRSLKGSQPLGNFEMGEPEDTSDIFPSAEKLLGFLEQAGQKCMEILRSFYYDKLPMSKLSAKFGFSSERSATVQKYKCLEKVRNEIKKKQMTYEDFLE